MENEQPSDWLLQRQEAQSSCCSRTKKQKTCNSISVQFKCNTMEIQCDYPWKAYLSVQWDINPDSEVLSTSVPINDILWPPDGNRHCCVWVYLPDGSARGATAEHRHYTTPVCALKGMWIYSAPQLSAHFRNFHTLGSACSYHKLKRLLTTQNLTSIITHHYNFIKTMENYCIITLRVW